MPELDTPELTLVRVDKEALNEYATARTAAGASVDRHLKANLSQLLGFDQVGNDRKKRWEASDGTRGTFYNMADVSWFYHADIQEAIPLFGTAAAKHRQLKLQHGITDGVDVFKQVVEGKRSSREGWFCGQPPPALATLPDGASIIGLAAARNHGAAGTVLPDAPPVAINAPAVTAPVTAPVAVVVPAAALAAAAAIPIAIPIGHLPRATAVPALSEGSMVSAEEALTAVMEAAKLTSQAYDAVRHYEYAGIDASQPEMLYTKTFTCAASCCRDRSSISLDSRACPFLAFTGRWQQQTVHAMHGVTRVAAEKRVAASEFAKRMKVDHLYAVFGSYKELGDRPYWLLWCIQLPYQAPKAPNNLKAQDGSTIRGGTWIFDAYFFESTSADQQRRSYKLLDGEKVHVTVESLIQEADLEFDRDGMHDRILGDSSHLKIMRHNFSNVVT
jgi:hypothetical protein